MMATQDVNVSRYTRCNKLIIDIMDSGNVDLLLSTPIPSVVTDTVNIEETDLNTGIETDLNTGVDTIDETALNTGVETSFINSDDYSILQPLVLQPLVLQYMQTYKDLVIETSKIKHCFTGGNNDIESIQDLDIQTTLKQSSQTPLQQYQIKQLQFSLKHIISLDQKLNNISNQFTCAYYRLYVHDSNVKARELMEQIQKYKEELKILHDWIPDEKFISYVKEYNMLTLLNPDFRTNVANRSVTIMKPKTSILRKESIFDPSYTSTSRKSISRRVVFEDENMKKDTLETYAHTKNVILGKIQDATVSLHTIKKQIRANIQSWKEFRNILDTTNRSFVKYHSTIEHLHQSVQHNDDPFMKAELATRVQLFQKFLKCSNDQIHQMLTNLPALESYT